MTVPSHPEKRSDEGSLSFGSVTGEYEVGGIAEYRATVTDFPSREVLEPAAAFDSWTTFVSHAAVRAIAVAPASRIAWIATWGGVLAWNRRDEYVYRRYSSEHGLAGTPTCIAVTDDDRAWVGHAEGGLSYFDEDRWKPYEYVKDERVLAVAPATNHQLWMATPTAVFLVGRGAAPVELIRGNQEINGATALLDDNGSVLVASPSGVFRVSPRVAVVRIGDDSLTECTSLARAKDGRVVIGTIHGVVFSDGTRFLPDADDPAVVGLAPTRTGLWVLTRSGVARVENGAWRATGEMPANVKAPRAIATAGPNDEYLWIGTDDLVCGLRATGASPWDPGLLPNHPEDALNNVGRCAVAGWGNAYVGTAAGLFVGRPDGKWTHDSELGDVRGLVAVGSLARHTLWALSWPGGIVQQTDAGDVWKSVPLPTGGLPRALVSSYLGDPHVLVGSSLFSILDDDVKAVSRNVPVDAKLIAHAPEQVWFAGTDRGLLRYANSEWSLERSLGIVPISAFGIVWFQLWVGVPGAVWTLVNGQWEKTSLIHEGVAWTEPVTAIAPSKNHETLWLACGGRVARLEFATAKILEAHDRFNSGVCGNRITALVEVEGALWVVSRAGIARHTL